MQELKKHGISVAQRNGLSSTQFDEFFCQWCDAYRGCGVEPKDIEEHFNHLEECIVDYIQHNLMLFPYLVVGRPAQGELITHIVLADTFEEAAFKSAILILKAQHEDFDDNIYIDIVTNKKFEYESNFLFLPKELRSNGE